MELLPLLVGASPGPTRFQMQGVHFRFDESLILEIHYLEGALVPARGSQVTAVFEDPRSFTIEIDAAEIAITTASLTLLLNTYVFTDKKSPLENLKVRIIPGLGWEYHWHGPVLLRRPFLWHQKKCN